MFTVLSIFSWLERFTLPCVFKAVFHHDCPGCGFQRSVLLLGQGAFKASWQMYPPAVPILLLFVFGLAHLRFKFRYGAKIIQYGYIFVALFVMINYIYKIIH
jgi:Protein of unknown function (DUF2752)